MTASSTSQVETKPLSFIQKCLDPLQKADPIKQAHWLMLLTVLLWSSAFVGIRVGLSAYSPGSMALLRYSIASFCMLLVYFANPNRQPIPRKEGLYAAAIGMLGIGVYNVAINIGEQHVTAGVASVMIAQVPIVSMILAICFLKERITMKGIIGVLISMVGISLIALEHIHEFHATLSLAFVFIATLSNCIYAILQKPLLGKIKASQFACCAIWGGTVFLLPFLPQLIHELPKASLHATEVVIYLGIFPGAMTYFVYSRALSHLPVSRVALYQYMLPIVTTFMGWLMLGEIPALLSLIGGVVALIGAIAVR